MLVKPKNPAELISMLKTSPLVLYGMGGAGIRIAQWCDENNIDYIFADKDAGKKQKDTDKLAVLPETLRDGHSDANIVITSIVYYDEIAGDLINSGIEHKRILSFRLFMPENVTWKDLEHTTVWGEHIGRMKTISAWIPPNALSVADYGEGKLSLKKLLNPGVKYFPLDYIKRSDETIICDFNDGSFPKIKADVSVCTATLVFVTEPHALLKHICENTLHAVILSYVTFDIFSNLDGRRASGYVNDFTQLNIINTFFAYGFTLKDKQPDPANKIDTLYFFVKN